MDDKTNAERLDELASELKRVADRPQVVNTMVRDYSGLAPSTTRIAIMGFSLAAAILLHDNAYLAFVMLIVFFRKPKPARLSTNARLDQLQAQLNEALNRQP